MRKLSLAFVLCALFLAVGTQAQTPQATPPPPAQPRSVAFPKPVEIGRAHV